MAYRMHFWVEGLHEVRVGAMWIFVKRASQVEESQVQRSWGKNVAGVFEALQGDGVAEFQWTNKVQGE